MVYALELYARWGTYLRTAYYVYSSCLRSPCPGRSAVSDTAGRWGQGGQGGAGREFTQQLHTDGTHLEHAPGHG